jgi:DNA (cytosine-5)-methyltransferase 1
VGWSNVFQCEKDEYCLRVLRRHFPNVELYEDIKETDFTRWAGRVDVISGGFPCQPFSSAGRRKGTSDDRYLWPEMFRAIREAKPRWVVAENVYGLITYENGMVLEQVLADLGSAGYEAAPPLIIPAAGANSFQRRKRIWIVANAGGLGMAADEVQREIAPEACRKAFEQRLQHQGDEDNWIGTLTRAAAVAGSVYGVPHWVDRVRGLGNAVDPRIAYKIFQCITKTEEFYGKGAKDTEKVQ